MGTDELLTDSGLLSPIEAPPVIGTLSAPEPLSPPDPPPVIRRSIDSGEKSGDSSRELGVPVELDPSEDERNAPVDIQIPQPAPRAPIAPLGERLWSDLVARVTSLVGFLAESSTAVDSPSAETGNGAQLTPWQKLRAECRLWLRENGRWYAASAVGHTLVFAVALLLLGRAAQMVAPTNPFAFQPADDDRGQPQEVPPVDLRDGASYEVSILNADAIRRPELRRVTAQNNDDSPIFRAAGGGRPSTAEEFQFAGPGGFTAKVDGPGPISAGRGGAGGGFGTHDGMVAAAEGYGSRGSGKRRALAGGGTKDTERAVIAALHWFFRHRNNNGSWSLGHFSAHCTGAACTGAGSADSDTAATSLALLTFLGAGETHKSKGLYRDVVAQGLYWLLKRQAANGDLSGGSGNQMYAHALGTIALCEAYGMTKDPKIGDAALRAIRFIEAAQHPETGGWRYVPRDPTGGDTSVLGWQIMALRSAQLAGIPINTLTMENAKKWLAAVAKGSQHGLYAYQPYKSETPAMTAIGMLSYQYLGMRQDDPAMVVGKHYLLENLPDNGIRNTYYWYYATQVMHNMVGPDWDTWNRRMRTTLIDTQCQEGCAMGSWDPESPTLDAWSEQGGRIVTTAFSTLTLEVYYRYLPLYNMHPSAADEPPPNITGSLDSAEVPTNRPAF